MKVRRVILNPDEMVEILVRRPGTKKRLVIGQFVIKPDGTWFYHSEGRVHDWNALT